ncbi:TPR-like protein [Hyaloscypha hepaticicola]|uniref:TPR-like protein n=1 Tax=Hyaloscypha hepaticicola TaxID=2082293 RepID=A0A2J6PMS1_9HELO|nr:TPR-like protein [Hyaloscypha hepaticicola]
MDPFRQPLFPTALPMSFELEPSAESVSRYSFISHEPSSGEAGIREEIRRQWESLKPLIQRIYIGENKPFPYLAKILHEEHGFEPTKRQFSGQVKKWGFRKNVSRSERRTMLQNLPETSGNPATGLQDRRVGQGKLKNWQRRYREGGTERLTVSRQKDENRGDLARSEFENSEAEICLKSVLSKELPAFCVRENIVVQQAKPDSEDIAAMNICQDPWPFNWTTVDIPGSPGLSRLFKRLEIEAAYVPALSLDGAESEDPTCLSKVEIQEVFNCSKAMATADSHNARLSRVQTFHAHLEGRSTYQAPHFPWRNTDDVFCGYSESPLREIYVFPSAPQRKAFAKPPNSKMTKWAQLKTQQADFESKYAKLKTHFSADNPAVIGTLEKLAHAVYCLDKLKKAECLYRELVDLYRQIYGPNNLITLEACHRVVETLRQQGHYSKAKELNDNLLSATSKLAQANHPFAIKVATSDAWISEQIGQIEHAESVQREILQIMLATHGPRNTESMRVLSSLGYSISTQGKEGGEVLLRTVLQLSLEDPKSDPSSSPAISAMINLVYALLVKGAPEESLEVVSGAVERFEPLLGANHPQILLLERFRAWSLLGSGKLDESEKLFENLAALHSIEKEEEHGRYLVGAWLGLARVLSMTGRFEDATGWYEKCFELGSPIYGTYPNELVEACYRLANWYEDRRLFVDALRIYQRLISEIREAGDYHNMIARLESEIRRIENKAQRDASEHESDSDDTDWSNDDGAAERVDEKIEVSMEMNEV